MTSFKRTSEGIKDFEEREKMTDFTDIFDVSCSHVNSGLERQTITGREIC